MNFSVKGLIAFRKETHKRLLSAAEGLKSREGVGYTPNDTEALEKDVQFYHDVMTVVKRLQILEDYVQRQKKIKCP